MALMNIIYIQSEHITVTVDETSFVQEMFSFLNGVSISKNIEYIQCYDYIGVDEFPTNFSSDKVNLNLERFRECS